MHNTVEEKEIWLNSDEACSLLGISRETFRRNCKAGKYVFRSKKQGKCVEHSVLLSSLPTKAQDKFYSSEKDTEDKELDIEIYSNAPNWAKAQADKYLLLFHAAKGLKGGELKDFLKQWNKENPEQKTSYPSYMLAQRKYKAEGILGLLSGYGHHRKGKSVVNDEYYEYFKSLYLKEQGPGIKSCWRTVFGYAVRKYGISQSVFPSFQSFKRRLRAEIPQQAIYFARYGEAQWNRKYAIYLDRDYSNVVAGDCWVSDHAQMDVMVLDENGKPTAPWLTVWRDFKTSKWLAWDLYCGNPNSNRIFHTFYLAGIQYGKPLSVYIDNGKDYRAKDFAGGRSSCDVNKAAPMLKLLDIEARFALPYNAQSKPVERDFLKVKEIFSRHLQGFRGGNVVERPEKLKNEIKNNNILKFADCKELFDDFIENVLNKMPSDGKNLKGKSPNQLWSEEFVIKRAVSKDELKLFCMRTSKAYAITRRGVKDGEIGVHYWADWMVPIKGEKVYLRRDPKAYQEAWMFRAKDEEYIGIATVAELTTNAFAETAVEKEHLQKAFAMKKREKKLVKEYIRTQNGYDSAENLENMKAAINQTEFADNAKVSRISKTKMSEVVAKHKKELQAQKPKKVRYSDCTTNTEGKRKIFLYESEKRRYERRLIND